MKNCTVHVNDDSVFEPEEEFQVHLGTPTGDHWSGAMIGERDVVTVTITNNEDGQWHRQNICLHFEIFVSNILLSLFSNKLGGKKNPFRNQSF